VLVYSTDVLERPVEVTGPIELILFVASSQRLQDVITKHRQNVLLQRPQRGHVLVEIPHTNPATGDECLTRYRRRSCEPHGCKAERKQLPDRRQKVGREAPTQHDWLLTCEQAADQGRSLALMPEQVLCLPEAALLHEMFFVEIEMEVALVLLKPIAEGALARCGQACEQE